MTLQERLREHRVILKSGDYDGAQLMAAWCDMINAADALSAAQEENALLREAADQQDAACIDRLLTERNELRTQLAAAQDRAQRAEALAESYRKALVHERTALSIVRDRQCHEGVCTVSLADIEKGIALLDAAIDAAREKP